MKQANGIKKEIDFVFCHRFSQQGQAQHSDKSRYVRLKKQLDQLLYTNIGDSNLNGHFCRAKYTRTLTFNRPQNILM